MVPATAPISGRTSSRRSGLVRATRSSAGMTGSPSAACEADTAIGSGLARALLRKGNDALRVVLCDKPRASHEHRVGNRVQIGLVQLQQHNRQIPLLILLLID